MLFNVKSPHSSQFFKFVHPPVIYTPSVTMSGTPASTTANLAYAVKPEGGVPAYAHLDVDPVLGERPKNYKHQDETVVIENIRGKEDTVSLDTTGFQFYKHVSRHTKFDNDEDIRREYYPESEEFIRQATGASRVQIFDHSK